MEVAADQLRDQRAPLHKIANEMSAWNMIHDLYFMRYASR